MERAVLVIEDHPQLAKSLCGLAKACGFSTLITPTKAETRACIHQRWTGVIADVFLPDGNVLDLLEEHRTTSPTLVLTGEDSRDIISRAFDLRASYLRKPVDPSRIKGWLLELSNPFEARLSRALDEWRVRYSLTVAELNVLELAAHGLANEDIARRLCISAETVKSHIKALLRKTRGDTLARAVIRLLR